MIQQTVCAGQCDSSHEKLHFFSIPFYVECSPLSYTEVNTFSFPLPIVLPNILLEQQSFLCLLYFCVLPEGTAKNTRRKTLQFLLRVNKNTCWKLAGVFVEAIYCPPMRHKSDTVLPQSTTSEGYYMNQNSTTLKCFSELMSRFAVLVPCVFALLHYVSLSLSFSLGSVAVVINWLISAVNLSL